MLHGAGWRVIKVVWGPEWDALLAADHDGVLVKRMGEAVDGEFQKYSVESGAYVREHFFGVNPGLKQMVAHLSDNDIRKLRRGGHSFRKVFAAYQAAVEDEYQPVAILAKTVKGWTLGEGAQGRNIAHQAKKLGMKELKAFRDRLHLDVPDDELDHPPLLRFAEGSPEYEYLVERRRALGGFVPTRRVHQVPLKAPEMDWFKRFLSGSGEQEVSTTGAFAPVAGPAHEPQGAGQAGVCPSSPTKPAPSASTRCSASTASTRPRGSSTRRWTRICC